MFQNDLFSWTDAPADFMDFGLIGEPPAPTPAPTSPAKPSFIVALKPGSSPADVQAAWQSLPVCENGKVKLTFSEPVSMRVNKLRMSEPRTVHCYRLFLGEDAHGNQVLGYINCKKRVGAFGNDLSTRLVSIEAIIPPTKSDQVEKVRKLANRFHPNAWDDQKAKLLADPAHFHSAYGYTVTSITGKFPDYVLEEIRHAFENKTNYSYRKDSPVFAPTHTWGGTSNRAGRDQKVECKLCDDGIFRAWYSSQYSGCANGDYWMLVNPTTAIFKERD